MANDNRPLVLLLGSARYTVEACVRLGIDAVIVSGARENDAGLAAHGQPTVLRVDDQASPEAVLGALHRAGLAQRTFDAVVTSDEFALVTAGLIAEHLGCRAIDARTALRFRDKYLQKALVAEAGIDTARVRVIEDVHDVSAVTELPSTSAVLKPVAGASTRLTAVVDSVAELHELSHRYRAAGTSERTFVLEEFIGGEEWIADGIVFDGEVLFWSLGAYGDPCLTALDEGVPLWMRRIDPDTEQWRYEKAEPVVLGALRALGLTHGVFHMELFHDPVTGRLAFGECGARRGGAFIQEEVQAKFGVDLGEAMLLCALGRRPELNVKVRPGIVGAAYLPGRPGVLIDLPSAADLMALPGVAYARVEVPVGTVWSGGAAGTDQRAAQILAVAGSEAELRQRFAEARQWFDERLIVAPHPATPRELRSWQRNTWPQSDLGDRLWL
ncbi:acetyl-CoA carboxylase biotin carboxylase subunit family protein [Streptomyces sp. NPDC086023]|uniref:acetyl-CoA carboxylase biotin carboxylase subunit family protein n=1 Tax=Streptomyces sp. NPDC086023 TaxID=3365746 RepID=UPI0037D3DD6D